jgi:segregation and condensation protein B
MGDISREPLPGGARSKGPTGKGPAEVIRLDELTVEERMETPDPREREARADDPAARGFPSPRFAPAAPMRIEPFALPVAREDRLRAAAEPLADSQEPEADSLDDPLPASPEVAAPDGVGPEAAAEDAIRTELELERPEPLEVEPPEVEDLADEVGLAVPEIDDLVADEDREEGAAAAEPMLQSSAAAGAAVDSGSDDAPPLTDPAEVARVLMAVLLCSREPLSIVRLAEVCNSTQKSVEGGLAQLDREFRERGLPLEILAIGDGIRIATSPAVYPYLTRLKKLKPPERLSPAALETLAVIAYRQPVIRAEIEAIRGVKVGPMLKSLLDHKLVKVVGRSEVPGRPLQYGTTQVFLDRFGLRSLKDLPSVQEFRALG